MTSKDHSLEVKIMKWNNIKILIIYLIDRFGSFIFFILFNIWIINSLPPCMHSVHGELADVTKLSKKVRNPPGLVYFPRWIQLINNK